MEKLKRFLNKIYNYDGFSFIEKTDEETYIFYPAPFAKGYEVKSLDELNPVMIYWRMSAVFSVFLIMTLFILLIIFMHQIFNMDGFFTITILTTCLTACMVSGFFMWYLRKIKRVKPKNKISTKVKIINICFVLAYILMFLFFVYNCPCLFYGHYLENQEWQKALNSINFFIKINPKSDNLYENRALVKYNLNDIDGAIKDCDKAIKINPKNSWVLSGKAYYSFVKTKKLTPEIMDMFEKSLTINKNEYPIAYSDLGKVHYLLKESDKAVKDFEKAYLKSGNEYFNYFAALAYEQKGDYCKAFAYYNTVPQSKKFQISELSMKKEYARFMCKE